MSSSEIVRRLMLGRKLDPLDPNTRGHVALIAFLAWVGLGADGLSSACYGPEEAFLALGEHTHMGLYLALATALTVFIIALAYNQVIDLFPSGGGGYKAATKLVGPYAGLVSGSALIVDYVLTIAISASSGVDALFSLFPAEWGAHKLGSILSAVALMVYLNLRGMKESIYFLMPIFLGFVLSHVLLVVYGVSVRTEELSTLVPATLAQTSALGHNMGWIFAASLFLKAYSVGGGTYTGLEAVSNNVNALAEPRVRTGHWTMFYSAASLAFTAGGIILLYLLWNAQPVEGQTLNAVVFKDIIAHAGFGRGDTFDHGVLTAVMTLEAGLLLVATNTGFLGGPAVLANMAADRWVPRQFRQLSSRLVTQYGVLMMGTGALLTVLVTHGQVALLIVPYSINVFLTFSLTLFGLCRYWLEQRLYTLHWRGSFALSALGFLVCFFILAVILIEKFGRGGWVSLLVTGLVVAVCLVIRRHYDEVAQTLKRADELYALKRDWGENLESPPPKRDAHTAVFLVGGNRGAGMYMLQRVFKLFPGQFANFVFVSVGEVDKQSFDTERQIRSLKARIENSLEYYVSYCISRGLAARPYSAFGADPLEELTRLAQQVREEFPDSVFFASKLAFKRETILTRFLHNQLPLAMQRRLELDDQELIIISMPVPENTPPAGVEKISQSR